MVLKTRTTLAEFLALPETKPYLELMDGEVIEKAMPNRIHGTLVAVLLQLLRNYLTESREARVHTEVRHLEDDEDWVFFPDVSVTLRSRTGPAIEHDGPERVLPDLAIEVLSPEERPGRLQRKIAHSMRSGVSILWVIDPADEKLTVWRPGALPQDYAAPQVVSAAPVLSAFELDLQALFDALRD